MAEAFGVAGSAVGVISLGIQVCQGLLKYYDFWKGCHQDIENTSKSIASLTKTLELVSSVVTTKTGQGEPIEQQISSIVDQCLTGIKLLSEELNKFEKYPESADIRAKIKSHIRRLYYPFKESTLAKLRDSVQDIRDDLVPVLEVLQVEQLSGLEEETKNVSISLASIQKARLQDDLRTWLSAPDPSVNQNAASKKCQKDTGGWLLTNSAYLDWRDRPDSFLWLQGFTGCGKTILCSTVINDMTRYTASRAQDALAFYYFDFANDVKTKTLSFLRSIILQLAEQTADTKCLQALQRAYAMGTPPIQEFLEVLKSMICTHSRVYIVVDALDECTDRGELFDLLHSIRDWKLEYLSILVTSRDEPDIRDCVYPGPKQEIRLRNSAIRDDLKLFVVETLQTDKKLQDWSDIFPEIEEALITRAHGMFRWVDCQFQTLRECPSRAEVRKALQDLPETLDHTYERMLRNIRPKLRDYAVRLLQWLCIADEPVPLDHVMDAFATSIGEEPHFDPDARFGSSDKVLSLCPGLLNKCTLPPWIKRTEDEDCVQIAHYSVKEYLLSSRLLSAPDPLQIFRVLPPLANLAMAKTSLVYAIFAPDEPHDLSLDCGREPKTSFIQFAREEWPDFFSNAEKDSQLVELAVSYLTRKKGFTLDGDVNKALYFAIEHGLRDLEIWLVDHHRPSIDPNFALLAKCKLAPLAENLGFVSFWIQQGADVNARSTKTLNAPLGSTPLHLAAGVNDFTLAELLVRYGAILEAKDFLGSTPLEIAILQLPFLNLDLAELLWFDGGQSCCNSNGENFLHRVAEIDCEQWDGIVNLRSDEAVIDEIVAWLVDHGNDPLSKNAKGETPLHIAARNNSPIAIRALYATTGSSSEYRGCLLAFVRNVWDEEHMLSTAQLLVEIDPDPFGEFEHDSDLFQSLLLMLREIADL